MAIIRILISRLQLKTSINSSRRFDDYHTHISLDISRLINHQSLK